jgi:hypothetical protein
MGFRYPYSYLRRLNPPQAAWPPGGMSKFLEKLPYPKDWLTNSWKFMLSSFSPDDSATKEDASRG